MSLPLRIRIEYLDTTDNDWRPVGSTGDSHRFYADAAEADPPGFSAAACEIKP